MKELQQYKFSDFLKIEMGQSPSSEYVNLEGIGLPLLNGPAEFTNTYPIPIQYSTEGNKIANAKDILFCVRGSTTGRMNIADQQYIIGRGLAAISHKEGKYLNSYVKGLLEYHLKFLIGGTCGSVFPNLTKEQLFNYTCYLPSLQVQEKIASILSSLDDKIELNNQLNDNLEQQAKLLYDYWFVQFEFPNEDGKPYKSSGGKMVYNKQLKREIPEGWEVKELGEIAELVRGVTYNKDDIKSFKNDLTIAILRATNISENKIDLNNPVFVNKKLVSDKQILNQFDILMTMSSGSIDHVGKNGLYMFQEQVSFGAFCIKIAPNVDYHYYTYLFLQSPFINTTIRNECLGTNINNLNGTIVKSFKVINPKKSILEKFNCVTNPLFYNISINIQQNQQLSSLRDWLLPMLMNGQVKVE